MSLSPTELNLSPLKEVIKSVFIEKNRCKYSLTGKMYVNPFCKFLFVIGIIILPFWLYLKYTTLIDIVNDAKMQYSEVDYDEYTQFTPYELFGITIIFLYITAVQLLFVYIGYVIMKECNCARITLYFWESPFWKFTGAGVVSYFILVLLFMLIFHRYSSFILPNIFSLDNIMMFGNYR